MTNGDGLNIELLGTGSNDGKMDVTVDTLDDLIRNFQLLKGRVQPMLRVGEGERIFVGHDEDADPALGHITELRRVGEKLIGTLSGCPSVVRDAVRKGLYTRCQPTLYKAFETTSYEKNLRSGARGPVLHSVALAGWRPPIVRTLQDLNQFLHAEVEAGKLTFAEAAADGTVTLSLRCAEPRGAGAGSTPLDRRINALAHGIADLVEDRRELNTRAQALVARADAIIKTGENDMTNTEPLDLAEGDFAPGTKLVNPSLAKAFLTDLDRYLASIGADPLNLDQRREAARQVLARWRRDGVENGAAARFETSDYNACVEKFRVPDGPVETPRPKYPGTTPVERDPVGTSRPYRPRTPALARAMASPLEVQRLGGEDRVVQLHEIAREAHLDLARTADRRLAERKLWAQIGNTVATARCFDEAAAALSRARKVTFGEGDQAAVALEVAKLRPDLVSATWTPKLAERYAPPVTLSEEEQLGQRFEQAVDAALREQGVPNVPAERARVAKTLMTYPEWKPHYGSARKGS